MALQSKIRGGTGGSSKDLTPLLAAFGMDFGQLPPDENPYLGMKPEYVPYDGPLGENYRAGMEDRPSGGKTKQGKAANVEYASKSGLLSKASDLSLNNALAEIYARSKVDLAKLDKEREYKNLDAWLIPAQQVAQARGMFLSAADFDAIRNGTHPLQDEILKTQKANEVARQSEAGAAEQIGHAKREHAVTDEKSALATRGNEVKTAAAKAEDASINANASVIKSKQGLPFDILADLNKRKAGALQSDIGLQVLPDQMAAEFNNSMVKAFPLSSVLMNSLTGDTTSFEPTDPSKRFVGQTLSKTAGTNLTTPQQPNAFGVKRFRKSDGTTESIGQTPFQHAIEDTQVSPNPLPGISAPRNPPAPVSKSSAGVNVDAISDDSKLIEMLKAAHAQGDYSPAMSKKFVPNQRGGFNTQSQPVYNVDDVNEVLARVWKASKANSNSAEGQRYQYYNKLLGR